MFFCARETNIMLRRALADYPDIEQHLLAAVRGAAACPTAANLSALLCAAFPSASEAEARLAHQRFVHFKEGRHGHVFSEAAHIPAAPPRAAAVAVPAAISAALRQQTLFSGLPEDVLDELACAMEERAFADGAAVVEEGAEGDFYYVIAEGAADVEKGGRDVLRLGPGSGFGEVALLYSMPRAATVRARVSGARARPFFHARAHTRLPALLNPPRRPHPPTHKRLTPQGALRCWCIARATFRGAMVALCEARRAQYSRFLHAVPHLSHLSEEEVHRLADAAQHVHVARGEVLAREGEKAERAYFVERGELATFEGEVRVGAFREGECCGERCLLGAESVRTVSIVAAEDSRLIQVDRAVFLRLVA